MSRAELVLCATEDGTAQHVRTIYADPELSEEAMCKHDLQVRATQPNMVLPSRQGSDVQNVDLTAAKIYLQADELALAIDSTQLMELDLTEAKFIRGAKKPAGGNDAA